MVKIKQLNTKEFITETLFKVDNIVSGIDSIEDRINALRFTNLEKGRKLFCQVKHDEYFEKNGREGYKKEVNDITLLYYNLLKTLSKENRKIEDKFAIHGIKRDVHSYSWVDGMYLMFKLDHLWNLNKGKKTLSGISVIISNIKHYLKNSHEYLSEIVNYLEKWKQ